MEQEKECKIILAGILAEKTEPAQLNMKKGNQEVYILPKY